MISSSSYEYTDRESIDSDLICLLCHNPFIDPIVTQCDYTYCRQCIEQDMGNGSHCPSQSCNQLLSTDHLTPPSRLVVSMLDRLKVRCQLYCPGKNIGCQWFGSRNEHDEHTKTCLFEKLRPMVDILYKDIEKLQKQTEQQTTEIGQLNTQVDQQKAQFEQQKAESKQQKIQLDQQKTQLEQLKAQLQQQQIQIGGIQSENQTQKNEAASIRKQITTLDEEMKTLRTAIHQLINISANATWTQNGVTIAGGHGGGNATNQLSSPEGLFVDDDQTVVIVDNKNHRIMQWKNGNTTNGQVVAGGNGAGNGLHQLNDPTDVLIDKETDSLIICDNKNQRVVRWSRRSGTTQGEILIDNIYCHGVAMDDQRYLYVSDRGRGEVRRYQLGENNGTLVAGGNGRGDGLNQLKFPTYLFVDRQQNVYVSDHENHRVMKWNKGAKEGIVVAGGQGAGNALAQLYFPNGIFVDTLGTLYVADYHNNRVMRWTQGEKKQGTVIVDGYGKGSGATQFNSPFGLSFDRQGNLYVADNNNHRVQRFSIE
ncbi:unnamed protein product [Rotaria socialis]